MVSAIYQRKKKDVEHYQGDNCYRVRKIYEIDGAGRQQVNVILLIENHWGQRPWKGDWSKTSYKWKQFPSAKGACVSPIES